MKIVLKFLIVIFVAGNLEAFSEGEFWVINQ
jgi:hypothetical protein